MRGKRTNLSLSEYDIRRNIWLRSQTRDIQNTVFRRRAWNTQEFVEFFIGPSEFPSAEPFRARILRTLADDVIIRSIRGEMLDRTSAS